MMTNGPERPDFSVLEGDGSSVARPDGRSAFRRASRGVEGAAGWLGDRVEDAAAWLANLVRYLPARVARLVSTFAVGIVAALRFGPSTVRVVRTDRPATGAFVRTCSRAGGVRVIQLVLELLDLVGAPEIFAFVWRLLTRTTPLTGPEIAAAASVLGPDAVRYQDIRVAEGGVLRWVFAWNHQRAFATFHTINLPQIGPHQRTNTEIVVHETVHVYQYERVGSRYFAEALLGQHEDGYDYGGEAGLRAAVAQGKSLRDFNREQQAEIAEHYYRATCTRGDISAYEPFIRQLREGAV